MTRLAGDTSEAYGGGDGVSMLQKLDRKEILEVLSEEGLFCQHCESVLQSRIINLLEKKFSKVSLSNGNSGNSVSTDASTLSSSKNSMDSSPTMSRPRGYAAVATSSPASVDNKQHLSKAPETLLNGGLNEEEKERAKFLQVGRKKDFVHIERIGGKPTNVLQGLELHSHVFNAEEQKNIVECVYNFQRMGQKGQLRERTYSEPRKWMRGKGRVTMQFGCCYNYSVDKNGNPPGIVRDEEVDPLPPLFKQMIKRMVRWHVLPSTCVPNSCIVNIYDEGDCIPPHIDHHDFLRPFCTVSFLTECKILFGSSLKVVDAGEFSGPVSIPLPLGSVLILNGNGADVAKHCIPAVPSRRISITFRKMDDSKMPYKFLPDPDLLGIKPLILSSAVVAAPKLPVQQVRQIQQHLHKNNDINKESSSSGFVKETMTTSSSSNNNNNSFKNNDFPPLGSSRSYSGNRQQQPRADRRVG